MKYTMIRRRLREIDMPQYELAERMKMAPQTLSGKMSGRSPWTEPEMQRLLDEIAQPEETLGDYFPRRKL